jgi:hypothetical protein
MEHPLSDTLRNEGLMAKKKQGGCPLRAEIQHSFDRIALLSATGEEHLRESAAAIGVELPPLERGQHFFQCRGCGAVWLATSQRQPISKREVLGVWSDTFVWTPLPLKAQ